MQFKTPRNDLQDTLNLLHTVLANWDMLAAIPNNPWHEVCHYNFVGCHYLFDDYHVATRRGLCSLLILVHTDDRDAMFECWEDFSGSTMYPVGGFDEYQHEYYDNKYANPQRKYLLTHCISLIEEYLNEYVDD